MSGLLHPRSISHKLERDSGAPISFVLTVHLRNVNNDLRRAPTSSSIRPFPLEVTNFAALTASSSREQRTKNRDPKGHS